MKISKKIICVLLAVLMLATCAPMVFAQDEAVCDHASSYEVPICPEGNATQYFMTHEWSFTLDNGDVSVYTFRYCPTCGSFKLTIYFNGIISVDENWSPTDWATRSEIMEMYDIHAPNIHNNLTVLPLEPTCKSMYFDVVKYLNIISPGIIVTDETYEYILSSYGNPKINEEDNTKSVSLYCYCNDCKKFINSLLVFDKDDNVVYSEIMSYAQQFEYISENQILEDFGMTVKEMIDAINACIKPAEPHTYEDGKCIYCGQAEPHEEETTAAAEETTAAAEETTAAPEEPTTKAEEPTTKAEEPTTKADEPTTQPEKLAEPAKKNFLDKVVDFFKKVGDWLKDLFTFKFISDLFKK